MASSYSHQVYQSIGNSYSAARRPDPCIQRLIVTALGDARSVVNMGAGTGNYEPVNRRVVAVEPSLSMIAQRGLGAAPAIRAVAEALPFGNQTFDAALAILTLHHLSPEVAEWCVQRLRQDLVSGEWGARYGYLRELPELDLGYRLLIAR